MRSKFRQIYYDLRQQPVIAWVTFLATAATIYLFVVFTMMDSVRQAPFAPESCRDRLLAAPTIHIMNDTVKDPGNHYQISGYMSYKTARRLYGALDGVDRFAIAAVDGSDSQIGLQGQIPLDIVCRQTDAAFFNLFDHTLLSGRYYTPQEAEAGLSLAVVTESVARKLFGAANPVGADCLLGYMPYKIIGVVADHSRFARLAYADVFIPAGPRSTAGDWEEFMGDFGVFMTLKPGVSRADIQRQVQQRYSEFNGALSDRALQAVYHGAPFGPDVINSDAYTASNFEPQVPQRTEKYFIYVVLLLIPAINLSTMVQSRMRRRISEIGVRRAYGCTRRRIFIDILVENLFITLAGGLVGLALAVVTALCYGPMFDGIIGLPLGTTPPLAAILSWPAVVAALAASVVLNLLSASVPAWRAACIKPVQAINALK